MKKLKEMIYSPKKNNFRFLLQLTNKSYSEKDMKIIYTMFIGNITDTLYIFLNKLLVRFSYNKVIDDININLIDNNGIFIIKYNINNNILRYNKISKLLNNDKKINHNNVINYINNHLCNYIKQESESIGLNVVTEITEIIKYNILKYDTFKYIIKLRLII